MKTPIRVVIVGASGYSGEELVRLLSKHPSVQIEAVTSRQFAGRKLSEVMGALDEKTGSLKFENLSPGEISSRGDVFFLALPHGVASEFAVPLFEANKLIFDLSADFRLRDANRYQEFYGTEHPAPSLLKEAVYAMPELYREKIKEARLLAMPGCYPTSIILALAPALKGGLIDPKTICANSASGVSGAGKKVASDYLFGEVQENFRAYGVPKHRHLSEIEQELGVLSSSEPYPITFIPHLAPMHRGIWTSISASLLEGIDSYRISQVYGDFYAEEKFVTVRGEGDLPNLKNVQRSNRLEISWVKDERTQRFLLFSVIDNLGKGAASQGVQAMNIRCGLPEAEGL